MYEGALFEPRYQPMQAGNWRLDIVPTLLAPGYWSPPRIAEDVAILTRDSATWMSMTPLEMESQELGIRLAFGHVVVFGMGMGWAAAATAALDAVTRVTIVECDPDVLQLHRELAVFEQLAPADAAKIHVVEGDARRYVPAEPVDLLMADIWLPLVGGDRIAEVAEMQANVRARSIYFWGQEMEIARHAVAAGYPLDDPGIAATISRLALPLIGTAVPDYAARIRYVSERWMRGRWLTPPNPSSEDSVFDGPAPDGPQSMAVLENDRRLPEA